MDPNKLDVPSDPPPSTQTPRPSATKNSSDNLAAELESVRWVGPDEEPAAEFVLSAAEIEARAAEEQAEANSEESLIASEGLMTRDQFFATFRLAFDVPQVFDADFAPLAIQPAEEPTAKLASDGVYTLLLRHPWTRKILEPQGEIATAMMQAAPFLFTKIQIVRMILASKAAGKSVNQTDAAADAANINSAPHDAPAPDGNDVDEFAEPIRFGEAA